MEIDYEVLAMMTTIREICKEGHRLRQLHGIPSRQPLASITISSKWIEELYVTNLRKM